MLVAAAANHDPALLAHAADLDGTRGHLTFGYGIHQCLGHNLARAELEIAFGTLLRSFPDLRLTVPVDEVPLTRPGPQQRLAEPLISW